MARSSELDPKGYALKFLALLGAESLLVNLVADNISLFKSNHIKFFEMSRVQWAERIFFDYKIVKVSTILDGRVVVARMALDEELLDIRVNYLLK